MKPNATSGVAPLRRFIIVFPTTTEEAAPGSTSIIVKQHLKACSAGYNQAKGFAGIFDDYPSLSSIETVTSLHTLADTLHPESNLASRPG